MPALLTSTSTPPNAATTAATPSLTAGSLLTSIAIPSAWPPAARISPAAASAAPLSRSATATLAPSRAYVNAISLPMPLAAPVTIAVLSLSFMGTLQIGRRARWDVPRDHRRRGLKHVSSGQIHHLDTLADVLGAQAPAIGDTTADIIQTCRPQLIHRRPRELVVLPRRGIGKATIDEVGDGDMRRLAGFGQAPDVRVGLERRWKLANHPFQRRAHILHVFHARGIGPCLARILDVLGALEYLVDISRQFPACAEQIDLNDERVHLRRIVEHVPQRCVGNDASIPIEFAVDRHRRKPRRQSTACDHVLGTDSNVTIVEVQRIPGANVDRAERQSDVLVVDEVEIDQLLERRFERGSVVKAQRAEASLGRQ